MSDSGPASDEFVEITRPSLKPCSVPAEKATITNVRHLASYNWIERLTPTIAVPGGPAAWSPPKGRRSVKQDSGLVYIAQNAARHPDSPLEPLFRALYIEQPSFNINAIDVVTDRNNIRKLLSFVNPSLSSSKSDLEPFTIQVEMTAQTAIFCRDETATYEVVGPGEFRGFGHGFEKAYTTPQVKDSTGHHRIISYQLGGLNFLVRHETDGFVGNSKPAVNHDSLANALKALTLSPDSTATFTAETASVQSKLAIKGEGRIVPRESTLEIKTRSFRRPMSLSEVAPQLWTSQTPKLVCAYHNCGFFAAPKVQDVTVAVRDWERAHQDDIRNLISLISRILRVTKTWGGRATVRYDPSTVRLVIKKVERGKMLPDDIYSRWSKAIPVGK